MSAETPKPVIQIRITDECFKRLRQGVPEKVEGPDAIVEISYISEAPTAGHKGSGCYMRVDQ
jgi:hypothetical protein